MQRLFYVICFAATVLAIVAGSFAARMAVSPASAQITGEAELNAPITTSGPGRGDYGPGNPLTGFYEAGAQPRDVRYVIANLVRVALGFIGIIMLVLTIYAGFLWFSARGNEDQVSQAKTILRNSVIGFVIVTLSYSITLFVFRAIFAPDQQNPDSWSDVGQQFVPGQQQGDASAPYQYQRSR